MASNAGTNEETSLNNGERDDALDGSPVKPAATEEEEPSESPLAKFIAAASLLAFFIPVLLKLRNSIHMTSDGEPYFFQQVGPYNAGDVETAVITGFILAGVPDYFYNNISGISPELLVLVPYLGCQNCRFQTVLAEGDLATLLLALHQLVGLRLAVELIKQQDRKDNWISKYVALAYLALGAMIAQYAAQHFDYAQEGADLAILVYIAWVTLYSVKTVILNFVGAMIEVRQKIEEVCC